MYQSLKIFDNSMLSLSLPLSLSDSLLVNWCSGDRGTGLTLNFPVAVVNTLNTKTHTSKEMAEFSFENADVRKKLLLQTGDEKQTATFLRNEAL